MPLIMKSPRHHILTNMTNKVVDILRNSWHLYKISLRRCNNRVDNAEIMVTSCGRGYHSYTRRGYVPVMVGNEQAGVKEKFLVKTRQMAHPSIVALLDLSADEFGYRQNGVLHIPCDPDSFRKIISN